MHNIRSKQYKKTQAILCGTFASFLIPSLASAGITANGTATLVYNKAAWATVAPAALNPAPAKIGYFDIHATPTGAVGDAADLASHRWMMLLSTANQSVTTIPYPAGYLGAPTPITAGATYSYSMPVNCYGASCAGWGSNYKVTDYDSVTNPGGWIGLGGSLKVGSDFNEPGASVWWEKLALHNVGGIWKIEATDSIGAGSVFELVNPVVTTLTCRYPLLPPRPIPYRTVQRIGISASYKLGNTDWASFFNGSATPGFNPNTGFVDINKILGTFTLTPKC
jgi:hypothetical protein